MGLLLLDLDHLKQVNDSLGHDAGDVLLQEFASRLARAAGPERCVARLGGDEFAIILSGIEGGDGLAAFSAAIFAEIDGVISYVNHKLDCRASGGTSLLFDQAATASELLKNADIALQRAKRSGRGRLTQFEPAMRVDLERRSAMIATARVALEDHRILPFYQPKVDLRSGNTTGFEALLRWRDREGEVRSPGAIIAALEEPELGFALSEYMLKQVTLDMCGWLNNGLDTGRIALNASAAEFRQDNLAERILERLHRMNLPPALLELEVTETVFVGRGAEFVERALRMLSAEGVTIALDDFGTGYASLSHLKQFPVDIIKIDRSFIQDVGGGHGDAAIVQALINLGKNLGIEVVAEGIETVEQAAYLSRQGCTHGQGYLFGRPAPATVTGELLPLLCKALPLAATA